jgi:hypothetical protein
MTAELEKIEMRFRHFASDLADKVEAGEVDELTANKMMAEFQDRLMRDGAWS